MCGGKKTEPGEKMSAEHTDPLRPYHDRKRRLARRIIRTLITRPAVKTAVHARVLGTENVSRLKGAYIVVANHSSHLDAPTVFSLLPKEMTEKLASGAAADYFYKRKAISALTSMFFNTYPIARKNGAGKSVAVPPGMSGRLLESGVPILVFPEGTRSRSGKPGEFRPGTAALALKLRIPIVPLALIGCADAMPVGTVFPKFGRKPVTLRIGEPMWGNDGETAADFMGRIKARIESMLALGHA